MKSHVLPGPNPFSEVTRIGFYAAFNDRVELAVYNILGVKVHEEKADVHMGEYFFDFDGRDLEGGTYFYRVTNSKEVYSGRLVKARK